MVRQIPVRELHPEKQKEGVWCAIVFSTIGHVIIIISAGLLLSQERLETEAKGSRSVNSYLEMSVQKSQFLKSRNEEQIVWYSNNNW